MKKYAALLLLLLPALLGSRSAAAQGYVKLNGLYALALSLIHI